MKTKEMMRRGPTKDEDRGAAVWRSGGGARGRALGLPHLWAAYEEVLQDIFAIRSGERLSANLTMQQPIVRAWCGLRAHDLIACLALGADELSGIVLDHTRPSLHALFGWGHPLE
jgi:hypothetical protein